MFVKNRVKCQSPFEEKINIHPFSFQQQLYALQKEKESRPQTRYDLSLAPKLKGSMKRQNSNIVMVKAVNKGVKFIDDGPLNTMNRKPVHEFRNIHKHLVDKPVTRVNISERTLFS